MVFSLYCKFYFLIFIIRKPLGYIVISIGLLFIQILKYYLLDDCTFQYVLSYVLQ